MKRNNSNHFKNLIISDGFTLAETLITIGVIGVVAAITLPTVMHNVRNAKLESGFKKSYSELSNAIQKAGLELGETIYGNYSGGTSPTIVEILQKQFKTDAKVGNRIDILRGTIDYKNYDGSDFNLCMLDDGTLYITQGFYLWVNADNYLTTSIQLFIDINGPQQPNKEGYDLFGFCLRENDKLEACKNSTWHTLQALTQKDYFRNLP